MNTASFETFRAAALAAGFDEVLERCAAPGAVTAPHTHAFDVEAVVKQGEMWLESEDKSLHLLPGDRFALRAGVPHAERYGADGATTWVARRDAA